MSKNHEADYARGFAYLDGDRRGAEELTDGRVRYFADETQSYWIVEREAVVKLGRMLRKEIVSAYSHWCAETDAEEEEIDR